MKKCNKCGVEEKLITNNNENYSDLNVFHDFKCSGEYISYFLTDLNSYYFSLCEKCLRQMFEEFVVPPNIIDRLDGEETTYSKDSEYFHYNEWRRMNGHKKAYENKKCNIIKNCPNEAIYTILHGENEFDFNSACEDHKNKQLYSYSRLVEFIPHHLKSFV